MRRTLILSVGSIGLVASVTLPCAAQTSADNKAAAEALFDEGLSLMKARKFELACPKLEQSERIDPGIGTLLYLAECYELSGRTASAWATFREAASSAAATGQNERAREGQRRADRLAPKLSRLTINVDAFNRELPGFELHRGTEKLGAPLFGTALPVDPGTSEVKASAPGYYAFTTTVTVAADGATAVVEIPPLKPEPVAAPAPVPPSATPSAPSAPAAFTTTPADSASTSHQKTYGAVLMGVGGVGLAVGGYFGLTAISKNNQAKDECQGKFCTTQAGVDASKDAQDAALFANIGVIGGAAVALGGAVLFFTAPDDPNSAHLGLVPTVGGAKLSLGGSF
ncbi:MAG: hypothetical protein SFV15_21705 [Polyangiaceae bacterium]|nr:hypothetical protein [Polyangiaceae bacterium]